MSTSVWEVKTPTLNSCNDALNALFLVSRLRPFWSDDELYCFVGYIVERCRQTSGTYRTQKVMTDVIHSSGSGRSYRYGKNRDNYINGGKILLARYVPPGYVLRILSDELGARMAVDKWLEVGEKDRDAAYALLGRYYTF